MMDASFVLEVFLAILLIACLAYCWRVERSLSQFRASRAQMDETARELILSVSKAEGAIKALRLASHETGQQLQDRITEARALADELAVMSGAASQRLSRSDVGAEQRPLADLNAPRARAVRAASDDSKPMWNR